MIKQKSGRKVQLRRETVRVLDDAQLGAVAGGDKSFVNETVGYGCVYDAPQGLGSVPAICAGVVVIPELGPRPGNWLP